MSTPEIPEAALEAAARVEYDAHWKMIGQGAPRPLPVRQWDELEEGSRAAFRDLVRPHLEAAAPHMPAGHLAA